MTDFEYILTRCRKYHFTKWDEDELRECQSVLPSLTRTELVSLYRSRLLDEKHPLRQTAFKVLFADKVGKREKRISELNTASLIEEFKHRTSGTIAILRKEMRERYKANRDRSMIADAFSNSGIKGDQHWVTAQIRMAQYGGHN